ncbi:hypothetical protein BIM11_6113 [Burkholderia pseudomallei]|nr:hypothetical protein BIM11_6113 [Burkholderia pseudomallei]
MTLGRRNLMRLSESTNILEMVWLSGDKCSLDFRLVSRCQPTVCPV